MIVVNCSTITYPPHESLQQIYILHEDISRLYSLLSYSIEQRYSIVLQEAPTDLQAASRSPNWREWHCKSMGVQAVCLLLQAYRLLTGSIVGEIDC